MFYTQGTFPVTPSNREWDAVQDALGAVLPPTYDHILRGVRLETVPELAHYLDKRQEELHRFAESHEIESWATPGYMSPEEWDRGTFVATVISRWSSLTQLLRDPDEHIPGIVEFVAGDILFSWWMVAQKVPDSFTTIHNGSANHMLPTEVLSCGNLPDICFIEGAQSALRPVFDNADQWRRFCWEMPLALEEQI